MGRNERQLKNANINIDCKLGVDRYQSALYVYNPANVLFIEMFKGIQTVTKMMNTLVDYVKTS